MLEFVIGDKSSTYLVKNEVKNMLHNYEIEVCGTSSRPIGNPYISLSSGYTNISKRELEC